jgi:hypothetical protein
VHSLTNHFVKFFSNIQPDGERVELAQDIADKLREYLKQTDKIKTINPHTRLSGSYARYTAVKKIKDVDVLLFVSEYYKDGEDCIKEVINDLVRALEGFPEYLRAETGQINADLALKRQRRSVQVHITLDGQEFDIDVVPSIAESGIEKPLLVPDRDLSKWVNSDPLGYGKFLSKLNKDHQNKIVPLIKMLKHWRDIQMKRRRPKSYWLECIVSKHANLGNLNFEGASWGESFLSLLSSIYNDFYSKWKIGTDVPVIKDPMLGNDVVKTWTRTEFETFMRRIEESKQFAEKALAENDEEKAIKLWQELFNDDDEVEYFPNLVDESLSKSLSGNSLFVSSSGQVLTSPPKVERSWQSPSHRNYGDLP